MKIIYGKHKNRVVPTIKNSDYRPTTSKFREALFSILCSKVFNSNSLSGLKVLDLYAGSGILSFEAISRGAISATLIDINTKHLKLIEKFANIIGEQGNIKCKNINATALPYADQKYNIVFMDPPYYNDLCKKTLDCLIKNEWLEDKAVIVMELEKTANIDWSLFPSLKMVKESIYSNSKLLITQYEQ